MTLKAQKLSLIFTVLSLSVALLTFIGVAPASAQSGSDAGFQITSSKDISAIQGESFTYFVVTANNTDFQLQSQLPSGLSFANGSISGTPQATGDYQLNFVAGNSGETETVNLSVLSSGGGSNNLAQANTGSESGSQQSASASEGNQESVSLDEIPETGLSVDQVSTLGFYLLALLLISLWGASKFTAVLQPATTGARDAASKTQKDQANDSTNTADTRIGDGVISE
jgi:hypothetical protein